jgi:hypothetical protein
MAFVEVAERIYVDQDALEGGVQRIDLRKVENGHVATLTTDYRHGWMSEEEARRLIEAAAPLVV